MNNRNTILVTGASGKIGYEIFKELIEKNFDVIGTYSKGKLNINQKKKIKIFL